MKIPITLRYQGKEYTYEEDFNPRLNADGTIERTALDVARYMYEEGNYADYATIELVSPRYDDEHKPEIVVPFDFIQGIYEQ